MIIQFFISLFLSIIITKILMNSLKKYFLVLPNKRSSHIKPTPTGGGLGFVFCGCFFSAFNGIWFPLICIPLTIVGLVDDFKGLNPISRYVTQALTSLALILSSRLYDVTIQNFSLISQLILIVILVVFSTAIINFLNFMDGIDGILASCMSIVFIILALSYLPYLLPFVGAVFGFLIFNWQPAKIFMGDLGSTFMGSFFVGCILQISISFNDISIFFLASPLLFDAFSCVIRRYYIGDNIFKPHKLHLYQRLNQAGLSHQKVTLIYLCATILLSLCYLQGNGNMYLISIISIILFGFLLDKKYALPFKKSIY